MIVTFDFASTQLSRRSCFIPYKDIDITVISHSSQQLSGHLEYSNNIWPIHVCPMNCKICLWHFRVEFISICFVPRINEPPMMANRMVICLASLSPSCRQLAAKTRQLAKVMQKCKWQLTLQKRNSCQPFMDIFRKEWISPGQNKTKAHHTTLQRFNPFKPLPWEPQRATPSAHLAVVLLVPNVASLLPWPSPQTPRLT